MEIKNRTYDNLMFKKVYFLWRNMMQRCYNNKHPAYKNYGNKGVEVETRWHDLNNFIEDVDKIEGFNKDTFLEGKLYLDKDTEHLNNKIYCLGRCTFVSSEESNSMKPNQQQYFIAISPTGERYISHNQSEFAREHNLAQNKISMCLKGINKTHKKWKFMCSSEEG